MTVAIDVDPPATVVGLSVKPTKAAGSMVRFAERLCPDNVAETLAVTCELTAVVVILKVADF